MTEIPTAIEEERNVLGAILVNKSVLGACTIEVGLRSEHFHREGHGSIYRAAQLINARGDAVSEVSVWRELEGKPPEGINRAYISELAATTPAALNAPTYARQIVEMAALRAKREGALTILEGVTHRNEEKITEGLQRVSADYEAEAQPTTPEEIGSWYYDWLQQGFDPADIFELPWAELNAMCAGGYKRGQMTLLTGWSGMGKALDVDTPIPTPDGWRAMGELDAGDLVFDENGESTRIHHAFEPMDDRECFEIEFSDGARIVADGDHQWRTYDRGARRSETAQETRKERTGLNDQRHKRRLPQVVTTAEIAATLRASTAGLNHSIPLCAELEYDAVAQPLDPYTFGVWLGDGTRGSGEITTADPEIMERIAEVYPVKKLKSELRYVVRGLCTELRLLEVLREKFIPASYLHAHPDQRRALLEGLMDSDGHIDGNGNAEYTSISPRLAGDVLELLLGLGYRARMHVDRATFNGKDCGPRHRVRFFPNATQVFGLERKQERVIATSPGTRTTHRFIKAVRPVESRTVRCIAVESSRHLFLAGRECIPTHNSIVLDQMMSHWSKRGRRCLLLATEMKLEELASRFAAKETGIAYERLITRKLTADDWARLTKAKVFESIPWSHHDADGWSVERILGAIVNKRPDIACIDPWNLIPHKDRFSMDETARQLKTIARRANCHVVVVAHLNTARMKDGQKPRPVQRDIRDSGMLYNNAHSVLCLHRENGNGKERSKGELYFLKVRDGTPGALDVEFNTKYLRFDREGTKAAAQAQIQPEDVFPDA